MAEVLPSDIDLTGLIDQHIHSGPDVWPRFADDVETVRMAAEAGMRALLLKSHVTLTADRAAIAEKVVGRGIRVFGALALNTQVGGLNPAAAEAALTLGAREIWMPTQDAANHRRWEGRPGGITILDDKGRIMVIATYNTDNGDGWEREAEDNYFFHEFSEKRAYPLAVNILFYLMTH